MADRLGRPKGGLIAGLRSQELAQIAANIGQETGGEWHELKPGDSVSRVYQRRVDLVSGQFAVIDDGLGFHLVPWSRGLDEHLGKEVSGSMSPAGGSTGR